MTLYNPIRFAAPAALLAAALCVSASATAQERYLSEAQMADGVKYLPAPPDTGSIYFFNDWARYNDGLGLRSTPRGEQATADAEYSAKYFAAYFSKALPFAISAEQTPVIYRLSVGAAITGSTATHTAKNHYQRRRPFMVFNQPTTTPADEPALRRNGSYPSGHTATGWAMALVLVEIFPDYQDEILRLGFEYGQSRTIVGAHWQSDVDAGRCCAAAAVARMHADEVFAADMKKAKDEAAKMFRQMAKEKK